MKHRDSRARDSANDITADIEFNFNSKHGKTSYRRYVVSYVRLRSRVCAKKDNVIACHGTSRRANAPLAL